jgi:hypothetical protein
MGSADRLLILLELLEDTAGLFLLEVEEATEKGRVKMSRSCTSSTTCCTIFLLHFTSIQFTLLFVAMIV